MDRRPGQNNRGRPARTSHVRFDPNDESGAARTLTIAIGSERTPPRWPLTAMLTLALLINYVDRGNLALAAPFIEREMHMRATEIGLLTSAFFWTYVPGQVIAGYLVDRLGGYIALAMGFAIWSLATALTGFAWDFSTLLGLRILLGIGETVAFPSMSKLFAESVPPAELGLVNAIATSGLSFGPAFGTLAGGLIIAAIGWRQVFLLFGGLALLWLIPWGLLGRGRPRTAAQKAIASPPPYRAILTRRALWGACLGHFAEVYGLYFVLSWLPLWLVQQHGYSVIAMAKLAAAVYCSTGVVAIVVGRIADRLIATGHSLSLVRKGFSVAGHVGAAAGLVGCVIGTPDMIVASLFVSSMCLMIIFIWPIAQTIAGPRAVGRWVGVQNTVANTAGMIGPVVTGFLVDRTGSFDVAFLVTAGVVLSGALGWGLIMGRVEPVDWDNA
jgi:MFS family permease